MYRRREVLRSVAAVGVGSLAGCSNPLNDGGGSSSEIAPTEWAQWVPTELFESDDFSGGYVHVRNVRELRKAYPDSFDTVFAKLEESAGIEDHQVDTTVTVGPAGLTSSTVVLGSFGGDAVRSESAEDTTTYGGYTLLRDSAAVADSVFVGGDYVRWLIDARDGAKRNVLEVGSPLEPLARRLSGHPVVRIVRTPEEPWPLKGVAGVPGENGALDVTVYLQFPERESARSHESTIRDRLLDDFPETDVEYDASSLRFDGSVAILEGSNPEYEPA